MDNHDLEGMSGDELDAYTVACDRVREALAANGERFIALSAKVDGVRAMFGDVPFTRDRYLRMHANFYDACHAARLAHIERIELLKEAQSLGINCEVPTAISFDEYQ